MANSPHAVQNYRAQGSGSGNSHRAPSASHLVNSLALLHFKLHRAKKYQILNYFHIISGE